MPLILLFLWRAIWSVRTVFLAHNFSFFLTSLCSFVRVEQVFYANLDNILICDFSFSPCAFKVSILQLISPKADICSRDWLTMPACTKNSRQSAIWVSNALPGLFLCFLITIVAMLPWAKKKTNVLIILNSLGISVKLVGKSPGKNLHLKRTELMYYTSLWNIPLICE